MPLNEKGQNSPAPNLYNITSSKQFQGGFMGLASRQNKIVFQNFPGPGSYSPHSPIGKSARKFSISPKLKRLKKYETPSPAAY